MLTNVNSNLRYLLAARRVLDKGGMSDLTMRAVAEAAGTTATAIYRHFADKAELMDALHRQVFAEFRERVSAVSSDLEPREALIAGLEAYRDYGLEHPAAFAFLFLERHDIRTSLYPRDFASPKSPTFTLLVTTVEACMDTGVIPRGEPVKVALGIDALALGLMLLYRSGRFGNDVASFRAFFRETIEQRLAGG